MGFKLFTRAEFRDEVRRSMNIVPPIDVSLSNPAGAQPFNYPNPTNQQINQAFQQAISQTNREAGFHVTEYTLPVAAIDATTEGPFGIYLGDLTPNTTGSTVAFPPKGIINDVQRLLWLPAAAGSVPVLVLPKFRDNLDRSGNSSYYRTFPAAIPQFWYIEGYTLYVTPSQSTTGSYILTVGTGLANFACDDDTLDQVPIDYQDIFTFGAVYLISIAQTNDVEADDRASKYGPLFIQGIKRFKEFKLGGTGAPVPNLEFTSYRGGYGTRRTVR